MACVEAETPDDDGLVALGIVRDLLDGETRRFELREATATPDAGPAWEVEADYGESPDLTRDSEDDLPDPLAGAPIPAVPSSHSGISPALAASPYASPHQPEGRPRRHRRRGDRRHKPPGVRVTCLKPPDHQEVLLPAPACRWSVQPPPAPPPLFQQPFPPGKVDSVPPVPMPEWLLREARCAKAVEFEPRPPPWPRPSPPSAPPGGRGSGALGGAIGSANKPSEHLDMYSRPVELPWKPRQRPQPRGMKPRPPWQDANVGPIPERGERHFHEAVGGAGESLVLPKLPEKDSLHAWREHVVNSALCLARTSDVPLGLLSKTGALAI